MKKLGLAVRLSALVALPLVAGCYVSPYPPAYYAHRGYYRPRRVYAVPPPVYVAPPPARVYW